ncbi:MAG TPA: PAS domain S-box protein [Crinalium sp.]|jgi:PAS domain S-box-containing protein
MATRRTVLLIADSRNNNDYEYQLQQDEHWSYEIVIRQYDTQNFSLPPAQQIDAILLDLQSLSVNSADVLQKLQEQMGAQCPPLVVVDGGDAETAVRAFKNGASEYLVKERMTPADLRSTMRSAIEQANIRRKLQGSEEPLFALNLSQQKQAEAAIHEINQTLTNRVAELQTLLDIIPVGIAIANDPACTEMQNNAYLRQLLGVSPGNNISKSAPANEQPPYRVFQAGQEIFPEDLPMQVAGRTGIHVQDAEFDILLPDGTVRQLLSYATPLRDDQNQIRGAIGAFLDITERNQAAAALNASQQRYRELAEAMPQMVWTADATGAVTYWNHRWYEYTGLSEVESLGLVGVSTVHPDERDRTLVQWEQAIASGQSLEMEYRIRRCDGVYRWFICRALPTRDSQNQITGWIGTITDIDDIKRSEALVQQSKQQMQRQLAEIEAIYQSAPIGLNVLDTDLRFVRINQRLADINGFPVEAHIGRTVRELFPDLADPVERLLKPVIETGEPLMNVEIHGETPAQPGVKRTWLEHFLPLKEGDRVVGISTVCEEITERIQVEAALRQSEAQFRNLADNAPMMIWVTDATGCCTYLSRSWYEFTGQTDATGLGLGWLEAVHPEDRDMSRRIFLNATERRAPFRLEYRLRYRDGNYRWAIDAAGPWLAQDGEFKGYIGSVIDISDRKQAEEALRRSEERYRTLFETMTEGFCVVEMLFDERHKPVDYRFLEVNPAFEHQTGLKQSEGKTARQLLPDLEPSWFEIYGNVAVTGEPARLENGSDVMGRWFEISAFKIKPPESRKVAILFRDISERKQVERELQESETWFRTLAENISQFAWMADQDGQIFWYNQRWFDYTGTTLEEMQGWGWQKVHHPDHLERVVEKIKRCFASGEIWEDTFPLRGRDGQYRWFLSRAIPVRDEQGQVLRWFGTNTDITDRKQIEEALQQSEERYRYLAEAIPQLVWTCDADGWCDYVNQRLCEYTGLTFEQAVGEGWLSAVHPDDRPASQSKWLAAAQQGIQYRHEYRFKRASDGSYRWHLVLGLPLKDAPDRVVKWFGTCTDIHDQKELEIGRDRLLQQEQAAREAAERANRIKDEFLAVLSHELRSPLNPILGWSKLLQTRKLDEAKTAEALAIIERNARVQTQLIDDLLDVAKILRGKLSLTMAPVNLATVIESAIDTVKTTAIAKFITLHAIAPNIGQVSGDAARLQQIIWNLLSNAVKFTPTGGRVEIRLEGDGGDRGDRGAYAQITVTDTGKGINPDFLPHIFESFRQEDASITRKYGGLGLGLAIVRQLVEAHGGTIRASSLGDGLGATFTVRLPLLNGEPDVASQDEVVQPDLNLKGIRILAVDDDPDSRDLLTALLTQYEAEVLIVTSAAEALANLSTFQPDVLVSDIGMPEVDGYALIQQIRMLPPERGGQIPAIALTAYARADDHERSMISGYQRHVTKPLEPEQLVEAVVALTRGNNC